MHTLIGFVRLITRRAVMDPPLTVDRAIDYVQEWLIQPCVTTVHPTYRHSTVLRDLLNAVGTAGNRVPDAHLAALAIEHGAIPMLGHEDFGRFPGLVWMDPLRT